MAKKPQDKQNAKPFGQGDQETLLATSMVQLYGRMISDIKISVEPSAPGNNDLLYQQLSQREGRPDPCLARVYCYVYDGVVYAPPSTFTMLVHGQGHDPVNDERFIAGP